MGRVSPEVLSSGGFNHGEYEIFYKGDVDYIVYSGFIYRVEDLQNGLHIVIGMAQKDQRRTWYFGTFEGPSWNKMSLDENERYHKTRLDILRSKNKVPSKTLEKLILKVVTHQKPQ
jgi:hypothetical protein